MKPFDRRIPAALTALVLAGQLCLPTAALSATTSASPEGDVSITQAFPDRALQSWLMKQSNLGGMGADGVLTQQERLSVTHLDLSGLNLTSLSGLELFPNLQSLDCSNNQLTALDLSGNPALEHVNCAFNRLTTLDLSQNHKLISLNCEMNLLTSLNLSGCSKLTALFARNNLLPSLDLSNCGSLEYVELVDNRLTSIDLSSLSNLHFIHLTDNRLTTLDLSHNLKLQNGGFMAEYNQLTSVTLPNFSGLTVPLENFSQQNPQPGYSQVAWYLDPQGSSPASDSLSAEGQTLYSKPIANQYTIYFSANGGSGSMSPQSAQWDSPVKLTTNNFSRPGYTFSHWSTQPQKDATTYQDEQEVQNLAGEKNNGERVTLYARWTPNQYTVVLNANGGTGDDVSLDATYGQSLTLTANSFEKDDKEFAGWSLTSNGPVRYPDSAQVQDLTTQSGGSVTLYAVWRTPLSEVQKPYLAQLEQAFQSYSSGRSAQYTTEDWDTLSAAYDKGAEDIRAAQTEDAMAAARDEAIHAMEAVSTLEKRVNEVTGAWQREHSAALSYLSSRRLDESNAQSALDLAQEAMAALSEERLSEATSLSSSEDRALVVGAASAQLQEKGAQLLTLEQSAQWVLSLDGLSQLPMEKTTGELLDRYQNALSAWAGVKDTLGTMVSSSLPSALEQRYELAGQKRSAAQSLETAYHQLDQSLYSAKGQAALAQALSNGLSAIQSASSTAQTKESRKAAWDLISQIPTADQEATQPIPPVNPPAGGGSAGGSGSTGGGATETPETPNTTVTDEKTGATAQVSTDDKGTVTAQVTLPQGVKRATLNIPAKVSPSTVAMVVKEDGSREILRKSVPTKDGLAVQVTGSCKIQLVDNSAAFADVAQDAWFSTAVQFTASRELFSGVGEGRFAPQDSMSRAMLVTVLYQLENRPQTANTGSFSDVAQDAWYHDAALWAQQQGITGGSGDGSFSPNASISRESLALMLYRSAQSLGVAGKEGQSLDNFADHGSVSPWAKQAMEWAYANGILSGNDKGQLAPQADSSRAEVSAMLSRFVELVTL